MFKSFITSIKSIITPSQKMNDSNNISSSPDKLSSINPSSSKKQTLGDISASEQKTKDVMESPPSRHVRDSPFAKDISFVTPSF